jgi:hypothetical protein
MQTFLPFSSFLQSAEVLDARRLGKQRVETFQILRALTWPSYAWKNHPAVRMWRGFVPALVAYGVAVCDEWRRRGGSDTVRASLLEFTGGQVPDPAGLRETGQLPGWLGWPELHLSHRSALVRKDPDHYRSYFPDVPDDLPYLWPPSAFPRWPVRRGTEPVTMLGFASVRPGQAEAVAALRAGSDVLLCMPTGAGATSTGLLAGLTLPRPTLWLSEHAGDAPADRYVQPVSEGPAGPERAATNGQAARPPSAEERAAMAEEIDAAARPDFVFHAPARLSEPAVRRQITSQPPGLIVVDDVDLAHPPALPKWPRSARSSVKRPPLLILCRGGPPEVRAAASARLGLNDAVIVGAGWDRPGMTLVAYEDRSEIARRRRLTGLVRSSPRPVLVVAPEARAARPIAAALTRNELPSAVLSTSLRPATVTDRLAAARRGRLAALVLDGPMTPAARALIPAAVRFRAVAVVDLPATALELHAALLPTASAATVLVRSSDAVDSSELSTWLRHGRCRWADLLDHFGEKVPVPCGRCDLCGISRPIREKHSA